MSANKQTEGVSVLDAMASSIMERKEKQAKGTLTPVAGEKRPVGVPVSTKELDDIKDAIARAQGYVTQILALTEQLSKELSQASWYNEMGPEPVVVAPLVTPAAVEEEQRLSQKAVEAAADEIHRSKREAVTAAAGDIEDIAARMTRLCGEAKAQVFTQPGTDEPAASEANAATVREATPLSPSVPVDVVGGWACPEHDQAIVKTSARRGREYRACPIPGCGEFERL